MGAAQRATQKTSTSLKDLLRKCEEVSRSSTRPLESSTLEAKLKRYSWRLTSLKDEAMKVEEAEGASLNKARLDKASDVLSKASARLLKLSEMVDKACFEVKAFMMEGLQVVEESRKREERKA